MIISKIKIGVWIFILLLFAESSRPYLSRGLFMFISTFHFRRSFQRPWSQHRASCFR